MMDKRPQRLRGRRLTKVMQQWAAETGLGPKYFHSEVQGDFYITTHHLTPTAAFRWLPEVVKVSGMEVDVRVGVVTSIHLGKSELGLGSFWLQP